MRYAKILLFLVFLLHTVFFGGPVDAFANSQYSTTGLPNDNICGAKAEDKYADESCDGEKQSVYSGSGFFITPNVIVTSNHIVKGASRIEIVYNNEIRLSGLVIGRDDSSDLALVRVSGLESIVRPLTLANSSSIRQGSRVYTIGFPLPVVMGMQPKISEGLISSTAGLQGDLRLYQISTPIQPGNSGGPLLNEQAEVVGVITGSLNAVKLMQQGVLPQNVNYAVKINNIANLISDCRLDVSFNVLQYDDKILSGADVMDIARKAVVFIMVIKEK